MRARPGRQPPRRSGQRGPGPVADPGWSARLYLGDNELGDETVLALAAPGLAQVRRLALGENKITDAGARALAASPYLERLESMVLWHNPITTAGGAWARFGDRVYPQRKQWKG